MKNLETSVNDAFWNECLRALETEPRPTRSIVGKSGLTHYLLAMGVDEARKRVIIVSSDADARVAALAREDIQARFLDHKIILARPNPLTLAPLATMIFDLIGSQSVTISELGSVLPSPEYIKDEGSKAINSQFEALASPLRGIPLNWVSVFQEAIEQLSLIKLDQPISTESPIIQLSELVNFDVSRRDREYGNCPIPIYNIRPQDRELILSKGADAARAVLEELGVLAYFFPEPDKLALGIVDRLPITDSQLIEAVNIAPELGHPLAPGELLTRFNKDPQALIAELKSQGYMVEGEVSVEVTEEGHAIRSKVALKPQEGTIAKIARVLQVKLDFQWPPKPL